MTEQEVRNVALALAGYYACQLECTVPEDRTNFEPFGADAIKHCYEYIDIANSIEIPYLEDGITVDTESFRENILFELKLKYLK